MKTNVSPVSDSEPLFASLPVQTSGKDIPTGPAHPNTAKEQPGHDATSAAAPPRQLPANEEPELCLEPDLPSDGRDEKGEAMIRDLPQRPELSEPPSQPNIKP